MDYLEGESHFFTDAPVTPELIDSATREVEAAAADLAQARERLDVTRQPMKIVVGVSWAIKKAKHSLCVMHLNDLQAVEQRDSFPELDFE